MLNVLNRVCVFWANSTHVHGIMPFGTLVDLTHELELTELLKITLRGIFLTIY